MLSQHQCINRSFAKLSPQRFAAACAALQTSSDHVKLMRAARDGDDKEANVLDAADEQPSEKQLEECDCLQLSRLPDSVYQAIAACNRN